MSFGAFIDLSRVDILHGTHQNCPTFNVFFPDFASPRPRRHRHVPEVELPPLPGPEEGAVQAGCFLQGISAAALRESNLHPPRGHHHRKRLGKKLDPGLALLRFVLHLQKSLFPGSINLFSDLF